MVCLVFILFCISIQSHNDSLSFIRMVCLPTIRLGIQLGWVALFLFFSLCGNVYDGFFSVLLFAFKG